ncbi:MAG: alpha/beta family hydrolase [Alphaproteobacteria bacterium]
MVLAHGAGLRMNSPFMNAFAQGLAKEDLRVVRFEFPYMRAWRETGVRRPPDPGPVLVETWQQVTAALNGETPLVIGGKSLGGRIASLIADDVGALGLVCLGYPFHPPGRPERRRVEHLLRLKTPTLIVQGTRDPFGRPDEVAGYGLPSTIELAWIEEGDHSYRPPARSGHTVEQNLTKAVNAVAAFVTTL